MSSNDAIAFKCPDLVQVEVAHLSKLSLDDAFFNSLRDDYPEFNRWYKQVSASDRRAWIIRDPSQGIAALCILKVEHHGELINDQGETLPDDFLKICTLKVSDTGVRYGERMLYVAFGFAASMGLSSVYVQVRRGRHEHLQNLLKEYGFFEKGYYKFDICYVKEMRPGSRENNISDEQGRLKYAIDYYPNFYDGPEARKFIISLTAQEFEVLFPDAKVRNLFLTQEDRFLKGASNAIRKAFLREVGCKNLRIGDLLLFYQKSRERDLGRTVECLGIVESIERYGGVDDIETSLLRRIPLGRDSICKLFAKSGYLIVVGFRLLKYFDRPIYRSELLSAGIEPNHRDVRLISEDSYQRLHNVISTRDGIKRRSSTKSHFNLGSLKAVFDVWRSFFGFLRR